MLIDTHCHVNLMVKKKFDILLTEQELTTAHDIITQAKQNDVTQIINVGTSIIESKNCIALAQRYDSCYAVVGIHPGDAQENWKDELNQIQKMILDKKRNNIVALGETGLDFHYKGINKQRQQDLFTAQIELALKHNLPLVIHTRDAADETLACLEPYKKEKPLRGVFHCFSQDQTFANYALHELSFLLGIGGIITYPKNNDLRSIVRNAGLKNIIVETDAPYLPPQTIRGKRNHPREIKTIANYLADFFKTDIQTVAQITTQNAQTLFDI